MRHNLNHSSNNNSSNMQCKLHKYVCKLERDGGTCLDNTKSQIVMHMQNITKAYIHAVVCTETSEHTEKHERVHRLIQYRQ